MFGQIPDFTNGFEFLRKMWGSAAGMPGGLMPGLQAMTPPMDLEELEKRIHDLKAVEGWLQLNVNLLRTTIQGLEVQRATLVALQTFGSALSPEAMQSAMENVARAANAPSAVPPHQRREEPAGFGARAEPTVEENEDDEDEGPPEAAQAPQAEAGEAKNQDSAAAPNAGLWWDMLQQQFNQIAASAASASLNPFGNLGGFGMPGAAPAAPARAGKAADPARPAKKKAAARKAGAKSTSKSASKSKPKTTSGPVPGTAAKTVAKTASKTAARPARKAPAPRPAAVQDTATPADTAPGTAPGTGGKPDTEPGGER